MNLEEYYLNHGKFDESVVFHFKVGHGGIGDFLKFFTLALNYYSQTETNLYLRSRSPIENYIKLKCKKIYIHKSEVDEVDAKHIDPAGFYHSYRSPAQLDNLSEIFYFSKKIKERAKEFTDDLGKYISVHARLGDMHLETEEKFKACKLDNRGINQPAVTKSLIKFIKRIKEYSGRQIFFSSDNEAFKKKIKNKLNWVNITDYKPAHTSYKNTTESGFLDAVTELYILSESEEIFAATRSGFPMVASKFNKIPYFEIF